MRTIATTLLALCWLRLSTAAPTIGSDLLSSLAPTGGDMTSTVPAQVYTMPFSRRVNRRTGSANMGQLEKARAEYLSKRTQSGSGVSQDASGIDDVATASAVSYQVTVGIGTPPTYYSLLIDTGSSNTWVGANKPFSPSKSTQTISELLLIQYGSGTFFGYEVEDQVTLAPGLSIANQGVGVAVSTEGFDGVDGLLGIGPMDLTCGNGFPDVEQCIPTVVDNAYAQNLIPAYEVGISFAPSKEVSEMNGELTFGGTDPSKYEGSLTLTNITSTSPANKYVGIDQSISYGDTQILATTAGIVDTGTTLLLLATDAFNAYKTMTGAIMDNSTGLLKINEAQYHGLENLLFNIGGRTFEFIPDAQLWPRSLNEVIGGERDGYYLIVSDSGSSSGSGLDFINGMTWLERFYTLYDIGNSRVGLATTEHTYSKSNCRLN